MMWITLLLYYTATAALSFTITRSKLLGGFRSRVTQWHLNHPNALTFLVNDMMNCVFCMGFWCALALYTFFWSLTPLIVPFALSGAYMALLLYSLVKSVQNY